MDVLVFGAGGLLGSAVVATARDRALHVAGTYHSSPPELAVPLDQVDISDEEQVRAVLQAYDPDTVINCAAMTDVDECETTPERAFEVNGRAPGQLATACAADDRTFVHISTDYVFDGAADSPYDETAAPAPIQVYGESKRAGEQSVRDASADALIARLSFVWGVHGATGELTGFPAWVRDRLAAGEATPLFTDQYVTPSRAGATAATILDLAAADQTGLFHVAARSCVTPYEFGLQLASSLDASPELLERGSQADIDRSAARPRFTCLDVGRVERALGREQPTLDADLDAVAHLL